MKSGRKYNKFSHFSVSRLQKNPKSWLIVLQALLPGAGSCSSALFVFFLCFIVLFFRLACLCFPLLQKTFFRGFSTHLFWFINILKWTIDAFYSCAFKLFSFFVKKPKLKQFLLTLTCFSSLLSCLHISPAFLEISVMEMPGLSDLIRSRLELSQSIYALIGLLGPPASFCFFCSHWR